MVQILNVSYILVFGTYICSYTCRGLEQIYLVYNQSSKWNIWIYWSRIYFCTFLNKNRKNYWPEVTLNKVVLVLWWRTSVHHDDYMYNTSVFMISEYWFFNFKNPYLYHKDKYLCIWQQTGVYYILNHDVWTIFYYLLVNILRCLKKKCIINAYIMPS